jgi:hypothetical protein
MTGNELPTYKLLELSTTHLRSETFKAWIDSDECPPWLVYPRQEFGFFLDVVGGRETMGGSMPNELRAIIDYAHEHGVSWLLFDVDADPIPALVVFK